MGAPAQEPCLLPLLALIRHKVSDAESAFKNVQPRLKAACHWPIVLHTTRDVVKDRLRFLDELIDRVF